MAFVEACEKKQPGTRRLKSERAEENSKNLFKRVILHKHILYRGFYFCVADAAQAMNPATAACCICAALNSAPTVQEGDASKA
jgi:hypothetical protein